jgi:hypothetical protein
MEEVSFENRLEWRKLVLKIRYNFEKLSIILKIG